MMKRYGSILLVLLLAVGLLLGGCGGDANEQQQEEQPPQTEVSTLTGEFQGLADGHSAEIIVEEQAQVYQFFDEEVAAKLEPMETGTVIQFDVETDPETEAQTNVKVYDTAAQG